MASRPVSPAEPAKKHPPPVQPNAHPYAIKTTSTALLSRSTHSSPHHANHTRHHYLPCAPSPATTGTRMRHRHSSSLSSVEGVRAIPTPLPISLSPVVTSPDGPLESSKRADEPKLTNRVRRAGTMPSSATEPIIEHHSYDQYIHDQDSKSELYAGLPPSPKQWNTDELATYLETSLKSGNNTDADTDGTALVDILAYVRTRGLTGRELLRLTDGDLSGAPLSDAQRAQLLARSRTLRAEVLRGRIYVDAYHAHDVSDSSRDIYALSARSSASTLSRSIHGASVSVDDFRVHLDDDTRTGAAAFPPSPVVTLHRSNSVSDASAQRYRDLARMRMRRRGRVKGLVETWERASTSGSECSASEDGSVSGSEAESESEADPASESVLDMTCSPEFSSGLSSDLRDALPHDVRSPKADLADGIEEPPSLTPPPPYTHGVAGNEEEEPSIEDLLASSSDTPLKGVRAWEADFGLGETVKRIPVPLSADAERPPLTKELNTTLYLKGDVPHVQDSHVQSQRSGVRGSMGTRGKLAKTQQRVVTAIFTGSPSEDVDENVDHEAHLVDHHRRASDVNGVVCDGAPACSDLQNDSDSALRALEASITATRAQMDVFRVRLEQVEADTTRQEAELKRAHCADIPHVSGFEARRRRSEACVQATDDTPVADTKDRDVLEGWETMSLRDITRAVVASAMGWLLPYVRPGSDPDLSCARTQSRPRANDKYPLPAKRGGRLALARMSCSILLVSFAICAAVLRRMGFGRWVRRP